MPMQISSPQRTQPTPPVEFAALIPQQPADTFSNICRQYLQEHDQPNQPAYFPQWMAHLVGQTFTRRISNFFSCFGLPQFYPAQRNYPTMPVSPECDVLARRYLPSLSTISENQSQDSNLEPSQICYEILPPQEDKDGQSIIYYIGLPTEKMPVSMLGKLYDWIRPVLYGSKHDWEAIQVDLDKMTQEPIRMSFETSNYSNDSNSYHAMASRDLHLLVQVEKTSDGTWEYQLRQQDGTVQKSKIPNPFSDPEGLKMAFVSWNSGLDLCSRVAQNDNLKLYTLNAPLFNFLDINTYREEGIDLRMGWLGARKSAKLAMQLPARSQVLPLGS